MRMDLLYASKFNVNETTQPMPEAYERLLLECLAADHSHFVSADELLESWRIFTPVLRYDSRHPISIATKARVTRVARAAPVLHAIGTFRSVFSLNFFENRCRTLRKRHRTAYPSPHPRQNSAQP